VLKASSGTIIVSCNVVATRLKTGEIDLGADVRYFAAAVLTDRERLAA
jgi:hypothetical protein